MARAPRPSELRERANRQPGQPAARTLREHAQRQREHLPVSPKTVRTWQARAYTRGVSASDWKWAVTHRPWDRVRAMVVAKEKAHVLWKQGKQPQARAEMIVATGRPLDLSSDADRNAFRFIPSDYIKENFTTMFSGAVETPHFEDDDGGGEPDMIDVEYPDELWPASWGYYH